MRKPVGWFADQMEAVLKQNDYKDGWKDCSNNYLLSKLWEEVWELIRMFDRHGNTDVSEYYIVKECADIGNIAMMIADNNKGDVK